MNYFPLQGRVYVVVTPPRNGVRLLRSIASGSVVELMMTEVKERAAKLFWLANGFSMAADTLYGQMQDTGNTMVFPAFVTNLSFSLELYLKTVYLLTTKRTPPKFHNVYIIYMNVPKEAQYALNRVHKEVNGEDAAKLPTLIETVADYYNTFRYFTEAPTLPRNINPYDPIDANLLHSIDAVAGFVIKYEHDVFQRFRLMKSKFLSDDGGSI